MRARCELCGTRTHMEVRAPGWGRSVPVCPEHIPRTPEQWEAMARRTTVHAREEGTANGSSTS
ncbi:MAG: hypothetical protein ACODAU_06630 [Myxococcota bacterium]